MALRTFDTIDPEGDIPVGNPAKTFAGRVVNQNGGGYVKFWFGTQAEYDALASIDNDVEYHITEE